MPRILIVYATTDGHTRKIAETLAETFSREHWQATAVNARHASPDLDIAAYDRVLVAASVHVGGYQRAARRWVRAHAAALNRTNSAFLSVCLGLLEHNATTDRDLQTIMDRFCRATGWQPSVRKLVAGAVPYTRYGWLKKLVMKRLVGKAGGGTDTTRDYEYTDWGDLREFAIRFADVREGAGVR
jgi:menaquinone-dependent protoporphyrinogen oxidase